MMLSFSTASHEEEDLGNEVTIEDLKVEISEPVRVEIEGRPKSLGDIRET